MAYSSFVRGLRTYVRQIIHTKMWRKKFVMGDEIKLSANKFLSHCGQWPNQISFVRNLRTYVRQIIRMVIFGGKSLSWEQSWVKITGDLDLLGDLDQYW